jgi:adenylate cyclase
MTNRFLWRLKIFFVLVILTSFAGPVFVMIFGLPDFYDSPFQPMLNGVIGGSMFWGIELLFIPGRYGEFLRRLSFLPAIIFRTIGALVIVVVAGPIALWIMKGVFDPTMSFQAGPKLFLYVVGVIFFMFGMLQILRVVGARVLLNIVFGRYQRPVHEERIFLFLDIQGSTAMAEELGDLEVQELINRFFFDITEPILEWGGEIHRYIGDEIVVTWPLNKGIVNARCLECCFAIRERIREKAHRYQDLFGVVPEFRIGLHGGPVVASQCGDVKQEIVYFGDTVNTAARIEHYCKEVGRKLLISEELARQMPDQSVWTFENVGAVRLRGRSEDMSLLAVDRQATA